ncbi:Thioredoxin [Stieleria neptunia]|uniref:Thioredoxin n=1 Tax=Stieleria neptunia TaxID=2527979 RepID=A0A518HRU5_9BACT|nr:HEAT repeat domain-containing protein [Stieleria neptunia]QDV43567.1 Thioredoxin [Stieleria neptunia]
MPLLFVAMFGLLTGFGPGSTGRADDPPVESPADVERDTVDLLDNFFGSNQSNPDPPKQSQPDSPAEDDSPTQTDDSDPSRSVASESPGMAVDRQSENDHPRHAGDRIEPVNTFEEGKRLALLEQRPLLVVFGAEWCGWCQRLENELTTPEASPILNRWVLAFVDVDLNPEIAQHFQVGALPSLRVLDGSGASVASRAGYMPLAELEAWLEDHYQNADPVLQSVLFASGAPDASEIDELTELLGWRSASVRAAAAKRLSDHRSLTAGAVVDQLRAGKLAAQLTALEILANWHAPVGAMDPWIPESINSESLPPLVQWLRRLPAESAALKPDASETANDRRQIGDILRELLSAPEVRHHELIQRAIVIGDHAADEAKRIESTAESLTDDQRQRLRRVRYSVLAGPSTRLANAGLIESLSKLDRPTHFSAAEKLLADVTSQDQPLIDELSEDRDPLVRELAVSALHRIGALMSGDRMQRLLDDESPSVRTAVLRQFAEDPDDEITKRLVEYLESESDEDLLIYATKILGKLASRVEASDALAQLIDDERWRVRAAALDAVDEFVSENSYLMDLDAGGSVVSEPVADAVLEHTNDPDTFVANKAQYLVPKVVSKRTADAVAQFLLSDLERGRDILESVEGYERGQLLTPLVNLSTQWLDGDDPSRLADAALLMTEVSPTTLRYRLDDLMKSDSIDVRLAAIRAFIPCMEEFREQSVGDELKQWRLAFSTNEGRAIDSIALIRPIPQVFIPEAPETDAKTVDQNDRAAGRDDDSRERDDNEDDPLDQIGSFFGSKQPDENAGDPTATDLGSEEAPSFDFTDSFFGDAPPAPERQPREAEDNSNDLAKLDSSRLGSVSYWLDRWQNRDASLTRPTWVRNCEPILAEMLDSDDPTERRLAAVALMVSGDDSAADRVLETPSGVAPGQLSEHQWMSWLSPEARMKWVRSQLSDLKSDEAGKSLDKDWDAATLTESLDIAKEIDAELRQSSDLSKEASSRFVQYLVRALTGGIADQDSESLTDERLSIDVAGGLAKRKVVGLYPHQADSVRWLIERYKSAKSPQHQAILLAALANVSRRHATAEALAVLRQPPENESFLRVATVLALSDASSLSVDRALVLLDNPNQWVAETALHRLASQNVNHELISQTIAVPSVYHWSGLQPIQLINRPLPKEALTRLSKSENATSAAIAETLLILLGNESAPAPLLDRLGTLEKPLVFMTLVLAKAGRTDDDAIEIYDRCARDLEWSDRDAVHFALSSLRDDRVKKIIKVHLQDSDGIFSF